jgi:hypothetical protein
VLDGVFDVVEPGGMAFVQPDAGLAELAQGASLCDTMMRPEWSAMRLKAAEAFLRKAASPAEVASSEMYTSKSKASERPNCRRDFMPEE